MRWRADVDGTVFGVCVGAAPHVPETSLREEADAVMASLRRLDEPGEAPPVAKPWWRIW
jgi:hypothetical protein